MNQKIKIGALISGGGSNLQAIIDACTGKTINADIVFVGSDNPDAGGLERAKKASIPTFVTHYSQFIKKWDTAPEELKLPTDAKLGTILKKQHLFPHTTEPVKIVRFFKTRIAAEADLIEQMKPYEFDLLILAGFMRTFTPYFIDTMNGTSSLPRIMNIHPAILPSFPGVNGYQDTFEYGCKVGGCTVHFVDYGEDTGPIIDQKTFQINPDDTLESVKQKGLELEWQLFPECIQLFAEKRLEMKVVNGRMIIKRL